MFIYFFFFFNDTATTEIYTLSLHDALPIFSTAECKDFVAGARARKNPLTLVGRARSGASGVERSEEHTSELQSRQYLVCRLLLEKKKKLEKSENHIYLETNREYNSIEHNTS